MAIVVFCLCDGALAVASAQPRNATRNPVAERQGHFKPAEPYKANRLSSPRASEPILNIPGQATILTREMLDDMNATSVRGTLRSVAGVTIGR